MEDPLKDKRAALGKSREGDEDGQESWNIINSKKEALMGRGGGGLWILGHGSRSFFLLGEASQNSSVASPTTAPQRCLRPNLQNLQISPLPYKRGFADGEV